MNKDKRNNIQLLGTLNNSDESGIIANASQIYDANEDKSTQDVSKEHTERIKDLEAKEDAMQTTLENISKTGEASAASNVTYNHNDSKLDATNVQQAIDEVRKKSNYNDGDEVIDFNTIHLITDNPEFVCIAVDADDKILYGIQKDGNFYFGAGCPQQVKDYVQHKIDVIIGVGDVTEKIDTINEMIAFFDTINNDTTLRQLLETSADSIAIEKERAEVAEQHLDDIKANKEEVNTALNTKVDKEEGKSLVNTEYAEGVHYIESPEFAEIKVDAEQRILEATYKDGTKLFPAGFRVNGVAEYDGATVTTISNPEFTAVWLDKSNRILLGIKNNADIFLGYGVPSQIKTYIDEEINKVSPEAVHKLIDFIGEYLGSTTLQELLDKKVDGEYIENPEYAETRLDSDNKIIEATRKDGTKVLPAGVETPKVNLEAANIENKTNPEYVEVKVDEEGKLLEGTRSDGTKVIGGNLEVGNDLNVKGDVEINGTVSYKNGIPQAIIDYVADNTGSGITNIEYEDETGDMYATFDDADGVTDVYMEENGDIYAEIEE